MPPFQFDSYQSPYSNTIADLMMEPGRAAAASSVERGRAISQAASQVGQAIGSIPGQQLAIKRQQNEDALTQQKLAEGKYSLDDMKRASDARSAFAKVLSASPKVSEDGVSVYDVADIQKRMDAAGFGPEGAEAVKHLKDVNDSFRQARAASLAVVQRGAKAVAAAGNDPVLAMNFLDQLEVNNTYPKDQIDAFRALIKEDPANVKKLTAYLMGPRDIAMVGAGEIPMDKATGEMLTTTPPSPANPTEASLALLAAKGDPDAQKAIETLKSAAGKAFQPRNVTLDGKPDRTVLFDPDPKATVHWFLADGVTPIENPSERIHENVPSDQGITPNKEVDLITSLGNQWSRLESTSRELVRQYAIMQSSLKDFDRDPNGASQGILVTFQKLLDPLSVVRESEYARSSQGIALISRISGFVDKLAAGGAGVPKKDLEEMVTTARHFIAGANASIDGQRQRIGAVAKHYNIDQSLVLTTPPAIPDEPAPGAQSARPASIPSGATITRSGRTAAPPPAAQPQATAPPPRPSGVPRNVTIIRR